MKRYFNMALVLAFVNAMMCLTACHEEKEWNPRRHMDEWGYFDGTINGERMYLENDEEFRYVLKSCVNSYHKKKMCAIYISVFESEGGKRMVFKFIIENPEIGLKEITTAALDDHYDETEAASCSGFFLTHVPKAERPVKINITDIAYKKTYSGKEIHLIEGDVDAVFYQGEDSISIKGHFATR